MMNTTLITPQQIRDEKYSDGAALLLAAQEIERLTTALSDTQRELAEKRQELREAVIEGLKCDEMHLTKYEEIVSERNELRTYAGELEAALVHAHGVNSISPGCEQCAKTDAILKAIYAKRVAAATSPQMNPSFGERNRCEHGVSLADRCEHCAVNQKGTSL